MRPQPQPALLALNGSNPGGYPRQKMVSFWLAMNLTIHVSGNAKDDVHFYITRGGFMEERMMRQEFRVLLKALDLRSSPSQLIFACG
ncbi:MAG TPA: hypothetical protein VIT91_08045 [Chthoniobacterales bacterium]